MIELVKEASGELELEAGTHYHFVVNCGAQDYHTEVGGPKGFSLTHPPKKVLILESFNLKFWSFRIPLNYFSNHILLL